MLALQHCPDNVGTMLESTVLEVGSLLGIVRFHEGGDVWGAMAALVRGGIELVEVTIDTPGALAAVAARRGGGERPWASAPSSTPSRCERRLPRARGSSSALDSCRR